MQLDNFTQAVMNDKKLPALSSLPPTTLREIVDICETLLNNLIHTSRFDWTMDDPDNLRKNTSKKATRLLKLLGFQFENYYTKHQNIIKLREIIYGDDEPFSDCGIYEEEFDELINDLEKIQLEAQAVLNKKNKTTRAKK